MESSTINNWTSSWENEEPKYTSPSNAEQRMESFVRTLTSVAHGEDVGKDVGLAVGKDVGKDISGIMVACWPECRSNGWLLARILSRGD